MTRLALAAALAASLGAAPLAAAADPPDPQLVQDLVDGNHILYDQGVIDTFGHLSARNPKNPAHFFLSRAVAPGLVTADDIIEYDLDGKPLDDRGRSSYVERFIHAEIYRARPDVMAVVHSHSPGVIPFGVTETPLRAMHMTGWFLGDGAPVFDAADAGGSFGFLINTPALGKALAAKLGPNTVVLMRAHGDTVVGRTVHEAVSNAIFTEVSAKLEIEALTIANHIQYLTPDEIKSQAAMVDALARNPGAGDRTWDMWKAAADRHMR